MKKIIMFLLIISLLLPFSIFANPAALPLSASFYEALILGATGSAIAADVSQMTEEERRQYEIAMKISSPTVTVPIMLTGMDNIHAQMAEKFGGMTLDQKRAMMKAAINQAFLTSGQATLSPALAPDASLDTITEAYNQIRDSVFMPFSFSQPYIDSLFNQIENANPYNFSEAITSGLITVKLLDVTDNYDGTRHVFRYHLYYANPDYDPTKTSIYNARYRYKLLVQQVLKSTGEVVDQYDSYYVYTNSLDGTAFENSISADLKLRLDAVKKSMENSISNDAVIGLSMKFLEDGTFSTKDVVTFPSGTKPWVKQKSTGRFDLPYLPDLDNPVVGGPIPFPSNPSVPFPHTIPVPANPALNPAKNPAYPWVDNPTGLPYAVPGSPAVPVPKNPAIPANPAIPDEATKVLPFFPDVAVPEFDFSPLFVPLPQKFPFCIPFDLVNAFTKFSSLASDNQWQPVWQVPFLTETITVDITMFNPVAKVIRYFVFLIFVVGLIHSTRKLIRG